MANLRPPKEARGDKNGLPVVTEPSKRYATIRRRWTMPAAHFLPRVHNNHKCFRMHGHNWTVEVAMRGPIDHEKGWVVDFERLDHIWTGQVVFFCDHRPLNEVIPNPTSENFAIYVWEAFVRCIGQQMDGGGWPGDCEMISVTVWEEDHCGAEYRGPGEPR